MLPEEDTIDAMFETVNAFCQRKGEKKNFWANFKIDLTSPRNMLGILAPGLLFLVAWGLVIINPLVGNLLILNLISLSLVLLMYISLF